MLLVIVVRYCKSGVCQNSYHIIISINWKWQNRLEIYQIIEKIHLAGCWIPGF